MTKHFVLPVVFVIVSMAFFACREASTDTNNSSTPSFSYQTSKCLEHNLSKESALDSVFNYSFRDTLRMDFSVVENCCPDSNRFTISSSANSDTIFITVVDTAADLCHCICPYMLHVEFTGLQNNQYVVCCNIAESENGSGPDIVHLVQVYRGQ